MLNTIRRYYTVTNCFLSNQERKKKKSLKIICWANFKPQYRHNVNPLYMGILEHPIEYDDDLLLSDSSQRLRDEAKTIHPEKEKSINHQKENKNRK